MKVKNFFESAVVGIYLASTLSALSYTMLRRSLPIVPWPLTYYSYGMMAPYQGYSETNSDLLAEGELADGTWERIDLHSYYPMILGNRLMWLSRFYWPEEDLEKKRAFAETLLIRERERGENYRSVRITWQEWPTSPQGFDAMRREPFIVENDVTQVP